MHSDTQAATNVIGAHSDALSQENSFFQTKNFMLQMYIKSLSARTRFRRN